MNVPILRELTPLGRAVLLIATLARQPRGRRHGVACCHIDGTPIFVVSALGILGLAYVVGASTERLGALTGPQVGGILNATFGNIAELIIAFFALTAGQLEVVKASLTGSIIGNLLLVLGASLLLGGLRNGTPAVQRPRRGLDATLLVLAVIGLFVPAVFAAHVRGARAPPSRRASSVAVILLLLYVAEPRLPLPPPPGRAGRQRAGGPRRWARLVARAAIGVLAAAAVLLAVLSEQLVGAIDPFIERST